MTSERRRIAVASSLLLLTLVGLWAYAFSLQLPLFLDDMVHLRWLEGQRLAGIWSSARAFGYYRPLPFTLWKLLRQIQGRYDPPTLHAVNLVLHILNAWLVLGVAAGRRTKGGLGPGVAAGVLFLLFPFSYQAVPWAGSLTHPLVTALILSSLVFYLLSRKRGSRAMKAASLALAVVAPFAHETGILIAPLLTWLLIVDEERRSLPRIARETWPYWACAALGLAVWLLVPKETAPFQVLNLEARWQNAVYFLQGLAYPVSPLATKLVGKRGLSDLWAIVLVSAPAVALYGLFLWRTGRGRLVALSLGWFAILAAPAWAMLRFSYVIDGPRLLYGASVGVALFWGAIADVPWQKPWRAAVGWSVAVVVVLAAACSGCQFIHARQALYEQMRVAVDGLIAALPEGPTEPVLCVNYPWWFAPSQATYAVGHEGVTLVPPYTGVSELLWLHTGQTRPVEAAELPDLLQPASYDYVCVGPKETGESLQSKLRAAGRVVVGSYGQDGVSIYDAGGLEAENASPAGEYLAGFDGQLLLTDATYARQGTDVRVELHWQCLQAPAQEITVFLHLYDSADQLVTQGDGYPVMGTSRPRFWLPGDQWRDVRHLTLPDNLPPGTYTLKAGLYPVAGGPRLRAVSADGESFQDDAVPVGSLVIP